MPQRLCEGVFTVTRNTTTIEVRGPRRVSVRALLGIAGAVGLPLNPRRPYHVVRLGPCQAIALWLEDQQRMVITVHEDDSAKPVTAAILGRLAASTQSFGIRHDAPDEVCYEFAAAS
jgi:hypothetical protein